MVLSAAWTRIPRDYAAYVERRRTGFLINATVVLGLVLTPATIAVACSIAYLAQPIPRRLTALTPAIGACGALVVLGDVGHIVGLVDDSFADHLLVWAGAGGVGPLSLRLAEEWCRRSQDALDPARYGLPTTSILLGRRGSRWVAAPPQIGALVIGPPRSGKTSAVIVPNVMSWQGPVVTTSTRRDVLAATAPVRTRRGEVWCFEPMTSSSAFPQGVRSLCWSPLRGCSDWDTATARARALTAGAMSGAENADHWRARASQLLSALLHAASLGGARMSSVVDWVHATRLDHAERILGDHARTRAAAVLTGIGVTPEREQGSIWSAVAGILAPFDVASVLQNADAAEDSTFNVGSFLHGQNTLVVVAPSDLSVSLAPLVVGLVEEIRISALRASERTGVLAPPLLLALDELANICPLPSLAQIASEGGGRNIILLAAFQDLSQATERYGPDVASGLLTLAGAKLILPGVADTQTLERLEALCGKQWIEQRSSTLTTGPFLGGAWTRSKHWGLVEQPRFSVADIRQLLPGTALTVVGRNHAEVVRLAPFQRARPFSSWAALTARFADGTV